MSDTLRDWQEGIAILLGALLIVAGMLMNGSTGRRREQDRRRNETRAILAALYGEIVVLRDKLAVVSRLVAEKTLRHSDLAEQFIAENMPPLPLLFERLVDKIGVLPSSYVLRIISFYASYEEARGGLRLLAPHNGLSYSASSFLNPAVMAVQESEPILRRMELDVGAERAPACDLGDAINVVDMLDQQYRR
ncbi:MAG: hypothetical protein EXQ93_05130 [Alphaproteobacteria bacterium]|nr:hypothetical protein [Alphaproteobacteria bacterium]